MPDLPPEEAGELLEHADAAGLALVPLIAPTTPEERLAVVGARARGFLYTVSTTGVTGERQGASGYGEVIERARRATDVPVALGFGISSGEQAAAAADAGADGVIVGSRLVRAAGESDGAAATREVMSELARAWIGKLPRMGLIVASGLCLALWSCSGASTSLPVMPRWCRSRSSSSPPLCARSASRCARAARRGDLPVRCRRGRGGGAPHAG